MMTSQKCPQVSIALRYRKQMTVDCIKKSIHSSTVKLIRERNEGLTVQKEDRQAPAEGLKGIPFPGWDLSSFYFPPSFFPWLFLPLFPPSSPLFSPQQDAAWTSARCYGNRD